jgi:dihydroorotate dehydrogenase (NAD+) catalytic subunit
MGGIESGRDALDFLAAGAAAIAVGTASFRDPLAGERVRAELAEELAGRGWSSLADARARLAGRLRSPARATST